MPRLTRTPRTLLVVVAVVSALLVPVLTGTVARAAAAAREGYFTAGAAPPIADPGAAAATMPDGQILLAGGNAATASSVYDPVSDTFTQVASMHTPRIFATAVTLHDGRVAVIGGDVNACTATSAGEVYDESADSWTPIGALPGLAWAQAAVLGDGRVLIVGELCSMQGRADLVWDPTDGSVTDVPFSGDTSRLPFLGPPAVTLADGRVAVVRDSPALVAIFDPASELWSTVAAAGVEVEDLSGYAYAPDPEHLLVVGYESSVAQDSDLINLSTGVVTDVPMPTGEGSSAGHFALLPDGTLLAVTHSTSQAEIYDPSTAAWREPGVSFPAEGDTTSVTTSTGALFFDREGDAARPLPIVRYTLGEHAATVPSAPQVTIPDPCCDSNDGGVLLQWKLDGFGDDGGSLVTNYIVTRVGPDGTTVFTVSPTKNQFEDQSVTTGGTDSYTVQAVNAVGTSPGTTVTPMTQDNPTAVGNFVGVGTGGVVVLSWAPPADDGGSPIVEYQIHRVDRGADQPFAVVAAPATTLTDTTVVPGQEYEYLINPVNAAGLATFEHSQVLSRADVTVDSVPNRAPTAADLSRTVPADSSSGLVLTASDPDGDALTYSITSGPEHGALAGTAPGMSYTPAAGYTGPDSITYQVDDGRGGTATATVSLSVSATGASSVSATTTPGQSLSTGAEPSASQPVQAAVTAPTGGVVTISADPGIADPEGYAVVGMQYHVDAPSASAETPLALTFTVAASALPPGQSFGSLTLFRDGVAITSCTSNDGSATPDPCLSARTLTDDSLSLTVLSSHASDWTAAVPHPVGTQFSAPTRGYYGTPLRLIAQVNGASSTPTGTVTFRDVTGGGSTTLATVALTAQGTATTMADLPVGTRAVEADYGGDGQNAPSSATATIVVALGGVIVRPDTLTAPFGTTPQFTYTVTGLRTGDALVHPPSCGVSGKHTAVGTYPITCTGAVAGPDDILNQSEHATLTVTLAVATAGVGGGYVGSAYKGKLTVKGGTGKVTWTAAPGELPPGVTLSTAGALGGAPTTAGTFVVEITVHDSAKPTPNSATVAVTVVVSPMAITTVSLPAATVGNAYKAKLAAVGGQKPYHFAVTAGALPAGIKLSAAGVFSGKPTVVGAATFTVTLTDKSGRAASQSYTLTIN